MLEQGLGLVGGKAALRRGFYSGLKAKVRSRAAGSVSRQPDGLELVRERRKVEQDPAVLDALRMGLEEKDY